MRQRDLFFLIGLLALILVVGWIMGSAFTVRLMVEAMAFALLALGLNVQMGYGGLFNFGVMGFVMLGGVGVTFFSVPINPDFWQSDGPYLLGRALVAAAIGIGLIMLANRSNRIGIKGKPKALLQLSAWFVAYILYRSQLDPAAQLIEAEAGFIGGLGMPVVLGWLFGGVIAGVAAFYVGKICLGLRTDYLAIATIGISEIIRAFTKNMDWLTNGTLTVSPIPWPVPRPDYYASIGVDDTTLTFVFARAAYLSIAALLVVVVFFYLNRAYNGPWGRMMRAIRDNHVSASAMGKHVKNRQLELFILGCFLIGVGGAILVSFSQIFDPGSFRPINHTFIIWVMVMIGGAGNNFGAIFGAVFIYIVWNMSEPVAQAAFMLAETWGEAWFGWDAPDDLNIRAAQMRVFVVGLVITLSLRFAPQGLIPERIRAQEKAQEKVEEKA